MNKDTENNDQTPIKPDSISDSGKNGSERDIYKRDKAGKFGAGNTVGKANKGKQLKTTLQMKKWLNQFISDKTEDMYEVWDKLGPKDKAALFMHIVKFVMPNETEIKENQQITIRLEERTSKDGN